MKHQLEPTPSEAIVMLYRALRDLGSSITITGDQRYDLSVNHALEVLKRCQPLYNELTAKPKTELNQLVTTGLRNPDSTELFNALCIIANKGSKS
jgi:hypothetical protein